MTAVIRSEARTNAAGEAEIWTNLGDVLDWLDTLPQYAKHPAAGEVALEIKGALLDQIRTATIQQKAG